MIKVINTESRNFQKQLDDLLVSRKYNSKTKNSLVKKITQEVEKNGDKSIIKYERKFSGLKKNKKKRFIFF